VLQGADIPLAELFEYLDLQALIAGQWQFRKPKEQSKEEYEAFLAEKVYPILEHWKQRIIEEQLLHPQAIYGYFPCQAEGNSLYLYAPRK
jgi:5-methyltetrahydrofolate--homocysteine methyltransferase